MRVRFRPAATDAEIIELALHQRDDVRGRCDLLWGGRFRDDSRDVAVCVVPFVVGDGRRRARRDEGLRHPKE